MYARSASYYDAIYRAAGKDYAAESAALRAFLDADRRTEGRRLLDVACGTGAHLEHLRSWYEVEGIDVEEAMVEEARRRLPGVPIHQADMHTFALGRRFDAVACLFGAIGYARTVPKLHQAIARMADHLEPGGVLAVEPWLGQEEFVDGRLYSTYVDEADLKLVRMNVSRRKGRISILAFEYLVGTPEGIQRFSERHELGLFTGDEYLAAFRAAGLEARREDPGLNGRGLYLARRPVEA